MIIAVGQLKSQFHTELRKAKALVKKIYTGKRTLSDLPKALQHFVARSGFLAIGDIHQVKIEWENAKLRFSKKGNWQPIFCLQHNFLPDPIRLVYMKAKIWGLMGVEAMDSFRHGKGNMIVKAAGLFNLVDANGYEMDKAELVTILAETMIIPDYALQTYIQWEEIDPYTIKGIINYHGLKASGLFYFNVDFEMIRFETDDRYFSDSRGNYLQTKWTAASTAYSKQGDIRFPCSFTATWNFPDGDFTYFNSQIKSIVINP